MVYWSTEMFVRSHTHINSYFRGFTVIVIIDVYLILKNKNFSLWKIYSGYISTITQNLKPPTGGRSTLLSCICIVIPQTIDNNSRLIRLLNSIAFLSNLDHPKNWRICRMYIPKKEIQKKQSLYKGHCTSSYTCLYLMPNDCILFVIVKSNNYTAWT